MCKIMVALITPFTKQNTVDYDALADIIERLLQEGIDGFVVCGTTAETPTLNEEEKLEILRFVIQKVKHRCEIWMGCGSNCTATTCSMIRKLNAYNFDGYLLVVPYYNKPSQQGIYQHFAACAHVSEKPIMLYNIPSRCKVELTYETLYKLVHDFSNIVALKHASKDFSVVKKIKKDFASFLVYSGEDELLDECLDAGMDGIISVMAHSNLLLMKHFIEEGRKDNNIRKRLKKEAVITFMEPSPACIKYILYRKGECENILRLPMTSISKPTKDYIEAYYKF